jgi:putative serine protease PepD
MTQDTGAGEGRPDAPWWHPQQDVPAPADAALDGPAAPTGDTAPPPEATPTHPIVAGPAGPDHEPGGPDGSEGPEGSVAPAAAPAPVVWTVPAPTVVRPSSPARPRREHSLALVILVTALVAAGVSAAISTALSGGSNSNAPTLDITESHNTPGAASLGGGATIPQLVHKVLPAVVSIDVKSQGEEDEGTGMIISSNGSVVTNNHVISLITTGGGTITVTESGATKPLPATLVGTDPAHDVALLKITNGSGLPTVTFGPSDKVQVGDAVVAIGNALGLAAGTPTVTNGIVSATGRTVQAGNSATGQTENLTDLIQTDAAINPGNSGGPLIDSSAQVIAMNTAVAGTTSDGGSAQNIGFAIPASTVESLLPELEKGGTVPTGGGYLGVDVTTLTSQLRQQYGLTPTTGAIVLDVITGSPAAQAGISQSDVIVSIGGKAITSSNQLQTTVQNGKPGQSVAVVFYVGRDRRSVDVTLGSAAAQQQQQQQVPGLGTFPVG